MEVAPNYKFAELDGTFQGQLQSAMVNALTETIPMREWLPAFRKLYESDQLPVLFICRVSANASTSDETTVETWRELLLQLVKDPAYRNYIVFGALVKTDPDLKLAVVRDVIQQNLEGDEQQVAAAVKAIGFANVLPPKLIDVLLHAKESKRQAARAALDRISGSLPTKAVASAMIDILRDPENTEERLAAIRTLSAIGSAASTGEAPALLRAVLDTGDQTQQVAAACALRILRMVRVRHLIYCNQGLPATRVEMGFRHSLKQNNKRR